MKRKNANEQLDATIDGGAEIEVVHLPASAFDPEYLQRLVKFQALLGTKEKVKVRQVLVSDRRRYCYAILNQDEATAIDVYCGKENGWADTLTPESADAIADEGLRLNLDFFSAWYRRQAKIKQTQTPEEIVNLKAKLEALEATLQKSLSASSSSNSPLPTG